MRSKLALFVVSLAGCFNPDLSNTIISCEPAQPECPEGKTCIDNRCVAPPDADIPDQSATDMSGVDGSAADMATASGCAAGGGTKLGAAFACAGTFSSGGARGQCASGYKICTDAAGIDLTTCGTLSGFFVADVPAFFTGTSMNESCGRSATNSLWYGCGNGSGLSMARDGVRDCSGFPRVLECRGTWNCFNMHMIEMTSNSAAKDGVLCCPN